VPRWRRVRRLPWLRRWRVCWLPRLRRRLPWRRLWRWLLFRWLLRVRGLRWLRGWRGLLRILGSVPLVLGPTKSAVVTVGGSPRSTPTIRRCRPPLRKSAQKQPSDGRHLPLELDNALKRMPMLAGKGDDSHRFCLGYFVRVSPALGDVSSGQKQKWLSLNGTFGSALIRVGLTVRRPLPVFPD